MTREKKGMNFEKALSDLEDLVTQLEEGELSLEESLKAFEKGIKLTRDCQSALSSAEQKVQMLVEENGGYKTIDLEEDLDDEENE